MTEVAREVDALGLICPLPVLRARKALMAMAEGEVLRVLADDPMALIDLPHFCNVSGHLHLGVAELEGTQAHLIRRGGG